MDVRASVAAEVARLPDQLRECPHAVLALQLAELIPMASPRDAATLSRELRLTLQELRAAAADTAPEEVDPVDELSARRQARITAPAPDRAAVAGQRRPRGDRPVRQRRSDPR